VTQIVPQLFGFLGKLFSVGIVVLFEQIVNGDIILKEFIVKLCLIVAFE